MAKVAGVNSGHFLYQDGNLISDYKADIDLGLEGLRKIGNGVKGNRCSKRNVKFPQELSRP